MLPDAQRKLASPRWRAFGELCAEIGGLPRHISQHPGGMVISTRPLVELVPVQPAAMAGRQMCQWDKDSCARRGLPEDRPARARDAVGRRGVRRPRSPACAARRSTSRASRSTTPTCSRRSSAPTPSAASRSRAARRCRPSCARGRRTIDDLTVQVALVRPGPIQGKAVHPYIERRQRLREDPAYEPPVDHPLLKEPLRETLGVVVFQDQVLDVAIASRRLHHRRGGGAAPCDEPQALARGARVVPRALRRGSAGERRRRRDREHASTTSSSAFSGFGFPKSHSAAFGLLAYQSAWLRHHYAGRVPRRAAERAADGLLPAGDARA